MHKPKSFAEENGGSGLEGGGRVKETIKANRNSIGL